MANINSNVQISNVSPSLPHLDSTAYFVLGNWKLETFVSECWHQYQNHSASTQKKRQMLSPVNSLYSKIKFLKLSYFAETSVNTRRLKRQNYFPKLIYRFNTLQLKPKLNLPNENQQTYSKVHVEGQIHKTGNKSFGKENKVWAGVGGSELVPAMEIM